MTSQVVFAEPVRTAIGTFGGSLKDVPATALGSAAIAAAVARATLRPEEIETVVMGNVSQSTIVGQLKGELSYEWRPGGLSVTVTVPVANLSV